jgi:hypothetical protein
MLDQVLSSELVKNAVIVFIGAVYAEDEKKEGVAALNLFLRYFGTSELHVHVL